MAVRIREMRGIDLTTDIDSTMSYGSAALSGSILYRNPDPASDDQLYLSTNEAQYLIHKDITTDGPSLDEKVMGVEHAEIKAGDPAPVILLKPGMEFVTTYYGSSSTGAISAATAADSDLGVDDNGRIIVKQSSGIGSTKRFRLLENLIGTGLGGGVRVLRED